MFTYHEVWANAASRSGTTSFLFGSYDRSDCVAEIEAEKEAWKAEGYRKIRIQSRETEEAPDPEVYGDESCERWAH